jgi:hypothetical protein
MEAALFSSTPRALEESGLSWQEKVAKSTGGVKLGFDGSAEHGIGSAAP